MSPGKLCAQCSRPLEAQPRATHKRFCNSGCRNSWHEEQRKLATALQVSLGGKLDEPLYDRISRATGVGREAVKLVIHALAAGGGN